MYFIVQDVNIIILSRGQTATYTSEASCLEFKQIINFKTNLFRKYTPLTTAIQMNESSYQ